MRKARPFWMYDAILDARTTEICRHRHGTVLPADDPWWRENWPPLHFNCRSGVRSLTPEQAKARGVASRPPETKPPQDGFGLPPDAEDWADTYARGLRSRLSGQRWVPAFIGEAPDWRTFGLPERLPERGSPGKVLPTVAEVGIERFLELLTAALGRLPAYFKDPTGLPVLMDSRFVDHVVPLEPLKLDGRERFLSWLPDLVQDPEEVWLVPMRRANGRRVVFRQVYVKVYAYTEQGRRRPVIFVAEFHRAVLVGLTFFATDDKRLARSLRKGFLRYASDE